MQLRATHTTNSNKQTQKLNKTIVRGDIKILHLATMETFVHCAMGICRRHLNCILHNPRSAKLATIFIASHRLMSSSDKSHYICRGGSPRHSHVCAFVLSFFCVYCIIIYLSSEHSHVVYLSAFELYFHLYLLLYLFPKIQICICIFGIICIFICICLLGIHVWSSSSSCCLCLHWPWSDHQTADAALLRSSPTRRSSICICFCISICICFERIIKWLLMLHIFHWTF